MRCITAAVALILTVGFVSACGGSGSGDDAASSEGSPSSGVATGSDEAVATDGGGSQAAGGGKGGKPQAANGEAEDKASGAGAAESKPSSGNNSSSTAAGEGRASVGKARVKKVKAVPLKVSGGGSEQLTTKSGDNSIQEFGSEAGGAELEQAAQALHAYYLAFSSDDWETACAYLAKSNRESLETISSASGGQKKSCAETSAQLYAKNRSSRARSELTKVDAVSLRRDGDRAFLIYHGADYETPSYGPGDLYAMTMRFEDGGWKVGLGAGIPLGIPKNLPESLKR